MFQHPKGFAPSRPVSPDFPQTSDLAAGAAATSDAIAVRLAAATPPPLALGTDLLFLWRRKRLIASAVAVGLLLSVAADLVITPRYRAISQIFIGPVDLRVVEKTVMPAAQTADANVIQVESETRILTSDRVLLRVIDSCSAASPPSAASAPT